MEIFFIRLSSLYSRTSWPPTVILPPCTSQNRAIRLQSVVLPPPEGPTTAVMLPEGTVKLTWSRIVLSP